MFAFVTSSSYSSRNTRKPNGTSVATVSFPSRTAQRRFGSERCVYLSHAMTNMSESFSYSLRESRPLLVCCLGCRAGVMPRSSRDGPAVAASLMLISGGSGGITFGGSGFASRCFETRLLSAALSSSTSISVSQRPSSASSKVETTPSLLQNVSAAIKWPSS